MWWILLCVGVLCGRVGYTLFTCRDTNKYYYRVVKNNYSDGTVEYALQYRVKYALTWWTFSSTYYDKQDAIDAMQRHIELDAKQARKVTKKEVIKS